MLFPEKRYGAYAVLCCAAALLSGALSLPAFSQGVERGTVYDNLSMHSDILGGERKYAVYLPPGYHTSERSYPVLYLLHGAGDDQTGWIQFGEVRHIADRAFAAGKATHMVIVMPDANTGIRGYFNTAGGDWRYEDFFFEEFLPYVESTYRIKGEKQFRAVAGLSMGGGGSFMYALHRPDLFSSSAPLSAYVGPSTVEDFKRWRDQDGTFSDEEIMAWIARHNAVELVKALPADDIKAVRWYIDCGDDDFLYEGNSLIHIEMSRREIPHEFRIRDGAHSWSYWRESLPEVLGFVSEVFHR